MANEKKPNTVKNWAYPFPAANGSEIQDPQKLLDALSLAEDGSYPIGANGLWHGGVHFDANTGTLLKQADGVRCIADGEVVAYRIDREYPVVEYPSDGRKAMYSTGFTLVRHRLELPAAPSPAAASTSAPEATATAPAAAPTPASAPAPVPVATQPTLVFFSLYMHLRHWADYAADSTLKRPLYWKESDRFIVSDRAKDQAEKLAPGKTGARMRNKDHAAIGLVAAGAEVQVGGHNPDRKAYVELVDVLSGDVVRPDDVVGYVYRSDLDPIREPDPAALGAVHVLPEPVAIEAREFVGYLGEYQRHQDANPLPPKPKRPLLHLEVFTCEDLGAFIAKSRARAAELPVAQKTLLQVSQGAKLCVPSPPDKTVPAGTGLKRVDGSAEGPWVKVQMLAKQIVPRSALSNYKANGNRPDTYSFEGQTVTFTGRFVGASDDLSTTSQSEAIKQKYLRREIELPSGEPIWIVASQIESTGAKKGWSLFPLQVTNTSGPVASHDRLIGKSQLSALPAARKAKDDSGTSWWLIDVGGAQNTAQQGWVCEKDHLQTAWKSPWDWAGFQVISETSQPADFLAKLITDRGQGVDAEETKNLKVRADQLDGGSLFAALKRAIDAQGNKDGKITSDELQNALRQPWLADTLTKLIVHYESEWGGGMSKWDALDPIMVEGEADWTVEKTRIKSLAYVNSLSALGLREGSHVPHLHSISSISNFISDKKCGISVDFLEKVFEKTGDWFCGKGGGASFAANFKTNYPNIYKFDKQIFVDLLNYKLDLYEITMCYEKAHFLSQCFHECAHFETTVEFGDGGNYEPGVHGSAIKMGNTQVGDGSKYRGRGLIQLTWKNNYAKYSSYRGLDFITSPEDIAKDMQNSIDVSCWYWRYGGGISKKYNAKGDINILVKNEPNNVDLVTLAVNGGTNGLDERRDLFEKIKKEWKLS